MSASSDIVELLRKNGNEAITLTWPQIYTITNRERLHDSFLEKLTNNLKKDDIHIVYGNNAIIIARDFCWKRVTV
ncbi:hypothetical protein C9J20_08150 [Photobacterium phosphoreum]|uniref:Uncharacterized protein n=1 Tax=Photobacterium phosphoreum TaxID=659 RepID=A0A2T3JV97_PHOPO|nr:hypothetical protein [Photobacterium phosphoreum]PSU23017.1 hypothetical protein CTM96_15380 [Photobacterium phosphoreum]PSU39918.1 hypothetical protein CTM97_16295 [Photobacterium phosphoreum]PSU53173.1 hypothetical protein C9J18_05560 [Photobacterium phosphoreum]PSU74434.1 hypothetical protein CTM79_00885 [Photobacterium phosphoreum]PSW13722.1 hypothetical protein C9J20_08150 [Photobacterium phosphoreum]